MLTKKIKTTKCGILCFLIISVMLLITGCSTLTETFGKEYRMVDDFWEQIEADLKFSFDEYFSEQELTAEQKEALDNGYDQLSSYAQTARAEMNLTLKGIHEYLESIGYSGSVSEYLEITLSETREDIKQELETATQGCITLKHTDVKRGFWGSIWHFIRNHWIISLIILGVICAVCEKFQEIFSKKAE